MAVAVGFEPTVRLPPHALSRRAPLAARTRHREGGYKVDREEGERRQPYSWPSDDDQTNRAEDRGFEPLRAINPTRFPSERHRPLGESSAGEITRRWRAFRAAPYPGDRPPVRCHLAQPPQGRKAARVGGLCQVRGGSRISLASHRWHQSPMVIAGRGGADRTTRSSQFAVMPSVTSGPDLLPSANHVDADDFRLEFEEINVIDERVVPRTGSPKRSPSRLRARQDCLSG